MTEAEAQKLVTVLVTAFPGQLGRMDREQQANTMAVYRGMLADLEYPVANAAVERLLATAKFMPTISEIRDVALTLMSDEQRAGGSAWGDVLEAVSKFGAYRVPGTDFQFSDPVTATCVNAMGWRNLCLSENQIADRARFIELYDHERGKARRLQLTEGLPALQRLRQMQERTEQTAALSTAIRKVLKLTPGGGR